MASRWFSAVDKLRADSFSRATNESHNKALDHCRRRFSFSLSPSSLFSLSFSLYASSQFASSHLRTFEPLKTAVDLATVRSEAFKRNPDRTACALRSCLVRAHKRIDFILKLLSSKQSRRHNSQMYSSLRRKEEVINSNVKRVRGKNYQKIYRIASSLILDRKESSFFFFLKYIIFIYFFLFSRL